MARLAPVFKNRRAGQLPLSSLVNVAAYEDQRWLAHFDELASYSYDDHIFACRKEPQIYRKGWEWTQTIYGLDRLGIVQDGFSAIGIGAGRECVIFWLADRLKKVVATDLYGNEGWTQTGGREADAAILEDSQAFSRRPITPGAVEFRIMDGTDLSFYPDESFDIAWSLSSIEHFGSHERAGDAVREMARVVRPGGVVVIATEYLLLADRSNGEYFNRTELEEHVIGASPHLALIEPVDWALPPPEYLIDSVVVVDAKAGRTRRHVVLNNGEDQWTSILVFFRRT